MYSLSGAATGAHLPAVNSGNDYMHELTWYNMINTDKKHRASGSGGTNMWEKVLVIIAASLFLNGSFGGAFAGQIQPTSFQGKAPADAHKLTSVGKYATALEAYLMYRANPEKVILLDVRTPEEYSLVGHAPSAVNIPSMLWTGKFDAGINDYPLVANPDFESSVKERFHVDAVIMVMCRSGNRSAAAVERLAKAGFKNLYNVTDGFEGDRITEEDSYNKGKRMKNGWRNSGVPWTTDLDPKLVYQPRSR